MMERKLAFSTYEILNFLSAQFIGQISNLVRLKEGLRSQSFGFQAAGRGYVIRISKEEEGFIKDRLAFFKFNSPKVPVPKVVKLGPIEGGFFAISERVKGEDLRRTQIKNKLKLLNGMFETLLSIHSFHLPPDAKFGAWNKSGEATFNTAEQFLFSETIPFIKEGGGFYSWNEVMEMPMIEKEVIIELEKRARELLKYVPSQKWLVHGDFGYDNLMVEGDKITGVLDWSESLYGDFLIDLAILNFWSDGVNFIELFKRYYQDAGVEMKDFNKRIKLYTILQGRNSLAFAALKDDKEDYLNVKNRIEKLLK